jgi:small subunit ribosomal protein S21
MIIIKVKEGESIDRALKRYKRKHRNIKVTNEIRERQHFTKKSVRRREEVQKAEYVQKLKQESEN